MMSGHDGSRNVTAGMKSERNEPWLARRDSMNRF